MIGLKCAAMVALIVEIAVGFAYGAYPRHQSEPTQKKPDVQIFNATYGGSVLPDTGGPIPGARITATVRNNMTDKAVTGLLWKIVIADARTHKAVEVIYAYTNGSANSPVKPLLLPPRLGGPLSFDIERKVRVDGPREVSVTLQDYVYKHYDPSKDKPERPDLLGAGDWPYKSMTEPVELGAPEKK